MTFGFDLYKCYSKSCLIQWDSNTFICSISDDLIYKKPTMFIPICFLFWLGANLPLFCLIKLSAILEKILACVLYET